MGPPLEDDSWTRRGISILWDPDCLNQVCQPPQVVSLRRLLQLHAAGWPEVDLPLVNDTTLVVAGLESCIDALPPEDAVQWLEHVIYPVIISYQREVADGGSQAALIFWLVERARLTYLTSDDVYYWHCSGEHKGQQIPLSHCLFNGAYHDLRRIHVPGGKKTVQWVGLFHPRIS
jgi:hypothetical protein